VLFSLRLAGGLDLLGLFQPELQLLLGQALGSPAKAIRCNSLMIWRSRSLSARAANSIALSRPGSSGRAAALVTMLSESWPPAACGACERRCL
jgi:hypothetical protein